MLISQSLARNASEQSLPKALLAILALLLPVVYGLILRPLLWQQTPLPLEIIFFIAACLVITLSLLTGSSWIQIQDAVCRKISQALPTILLLFAIGLIIGSWIIAGTIPMLVYYALSWISADYLYLCAFVAPVIFSLCTGTSWGAIATIGIVLMAVAKVYQADTAIVAGAIVAGAYFGDKLSPLSDTTNIAAVAVNVPLYAHIQSMLITTLPSAVLAAIGFFLLDVYKAELVSTTSSELLTLTLAQLQHVFQFNWLLLFPPVLVLLGAIRHWPPLITIVLSSLCAVVLALIFQSVELDHILQTLYRGFELNFIAGVNPDLINEVLVTLLSRGGLYALHEAVIITLLIFIYVGVLDCLGAIPVLIARISKGIKHQSSLVFTTLIASAGTNALTSSQYANSFINGEAFSPLYDQQQVDRRVLSRSLEDTGTLIESLVPWSTTAVFVASTLGVSVGQYWQWQLLSLINIPLAFIFAFLGIGIFKKASK